MTPKSEKKRKYLLHATENLFKKRNENMRESVEQFVPQNSVLIVLAFLTKREDDILLATPLRQTSRH